MLQIPVLRADIPAGITNERGAWITPAFQLHASRLDIVRQAGGLPASARVGRPTLLAPGPSAAAQQQHPRSNGQTATDAGQQPTSTTDGSLQGLASQQYQVSQHQVPPQKEQQQQNGQQTVPQFECLLLDCDGVLVDTEVASCESLHLAIREVSWAGMYAGDGDAAGGLHQGVYCVHVLLTSQEEEVSSSRSGLTCASYTQVYGHLICQAAVLL
jgi:hypothetical protein